MEQEYNWLASFQWALYLYIQLLPLQITRDLCVTITLTYSGRRNCANSCLQYYIRLHHVIIMWSDIMWSEFACPANQQPKKHNQEKKPTNLCTPQTNVSAMFDNHKILFWLLNKQQTFHILSLHNLLIMFCSLDLDVLRVQRIMGSFYLITHKSMGSEHLITWQGTVESQLHLLD